MKVLYLYAEIMGYNLPVLNILSQDYCADVTVISWKKKLTKYKIDDNANAINFLYKEDFSNAELRLFCLGLKPDIIVVSGWMDKDYLKICKEIKKNKLSIIVGASDTQWSNSFKHKVATIVSPIYHKTFFDYLWVSGVWQYDYARKLGFPNNKIVFNCLSADLEVVKNNKPKINTQRTLLFLGRFDKVKGIDLLLNAFKEFKEESNSTLKLKLIGGGVEYDYVKSFESESIIVKDFVQPENLIDELVDVDGFILPSVYEPWGLVIHEMAAASLPLLLTNICGANTMFAINNFNSFLFNPNNFDELKSSIFKFDQLTDEELLKMGQRSKLLSNRITPEISAASLMSIFPNL